MKHTIYSYTVSWYKKFILYCINTVLILSLTIVAEHSLRLWNVQFHRWTVPKNVTVPYHTQWLIALSYFNIDRVGIMNTD